jgi:NAD+ synthase (glutamine-hydrolysing)
MRVALAQINSLLGDFKHNREKIVEYTKRAQEKHCDLVVFPELSLFGYIPADLLERESVVAAQLKEFEHLHKSIPAGIAVLVGLVTKNKNGKPFQNTAAFLEKGKKPKFFSKQLLPNYDIFDEERYFEPGDVSQNILKFKGKRILVTICEDIWGWGQDWAGANYSKNPLAALKGERFDLVVNVSASPFSKRKEKARRDVIKKTAIFFKAPMVYVNLVGAQDEIIFDGGSQAVDSKGKLLAHSIFFEEDLNVVDFEKKVGGTREIKKSETELIHEALVLGIRDFTSKNGFSKVHLGLSGGIDSAVVLCLAVDALGPGKVSCLAMPGPFSAPESLQLALQLAKNLGVSIKDVPINKSFEAVSKSFEEGVGKTEFGVVHENMQARLRGLMLMAFSNRENSLLLTTGNKSEYAAGYTTLYGDMCGGLAPIADLLKREVYALASYFNREIELIPAQIIKRAPTAELRPNQTDQDTLPPYDVLDRAVEKLVERAKVPSSEEEKWLLKAMFRSEFKRWQAPPILRVTSHAFGRGRRVPITNKALF